VEVAGKERVRWGATAVACLTSLAGAGAVAGWFLRDAALARLYVFTHPVSFFTALGLAGVGVALGGLVHGYRRVAFWGAVVGLLAGIARWLGLVTGVEWEALVGIPWPSGRPRELPVAVEASSATCLLVAGLGMAVSSWKARWRVVALGLPGLVIWALAAADGIRWLGPVTWVPGISRVAPMAPQAAVAFFLVGLTLMLLSLVEARQAARAPSLKPALVFTLLVLAAMVSVWWALQARRWEELQELFSLQARYLREHLQQELEERVLAVKSWAVVAGTAELHPQQRASWATIALASQPGVVGLAQLDGSCRVLWHVARDGYEAVFEPEPWYSSEDCDYLGRKLRIGQHELMDVDRVPGAYDFDVVTLTGDRGGPYLVGVIDTTLFLEEALGEARKQFGVALYADRQLLYWSSPDRGTLPVSGALRQVYETRYDNRDLRLEMWPGTAWLARTSSSAPELVLMLGVVLALILGATVYLAEVAVTRAGEAQLARRTAEALLWERDRIRAELDRLFFLSPDLLCVASLEGYLRELNPAWERLLGYSLEELRGRSLFDLLHPDDQASARKQFDRLACGETVTDYEARLITRDGQERWLLWAMTGVPEARLVYIVAADITERRRAEEALEDYAAELRRANRELSLALAAAKEATEAKSRFLAAVSHEIRTPLNGILGMNELLLCTPLTEEQRLYARTIKESTQSLLAIVNDLLDASRIEAGRLEIEAVPFDLGAVAGEVLTLLLPQARSKDLELTLDIEEDVPRWVVGDPLRVRQVLLNLVSNAVKFTEQGYVRIQIRKLRQEGEKTRLRFEVQDTGIGVPPDKKEEIFKEFVQADGSIARRYSGTGLGLSIAKKLVELMGGEIGCESELGAGSLFWFEIPFGKAEGPVPSGAKPSAREGQRGAGVSGRRVLVVEDNDVNRVIAVRLLRKLGCQVLAASGGEEALEILRREAVDLVLMDVNMPGMDGFATTEAIRRMGGEASRVPVLALTARASGDDEQECLRHGMNGLISKPVSLESLRAAVEAWAGMCSENSPRDPSVA